MGVPRSRFMLFHRMVLLPPLMLLTLTCLYTSSTLRPFSSTHHHSFHQDVQCFSCDSSSFPSRTFLSLANFPASSYIRDVVLRHNVLNVEDSREETDPELVSRPDTNEMDSKSVNDSENVPDEVQASGEETLAEIVIRQQELSDDKAIRTESIEKEVHEGEGQTNTVLSHEKVAQGNDRGDSSSTGNVAAFDEQMENYTPSENKADSSVSLHDNDVGGYVLAGQDGDSSARIVQHSSAQEKSFEGQEERTQASSLSTANLNVDSSVENLKVSTETTDNSGEESKEDVGVSTSKENNVHSSVEVVEISPESKEDSEEGKGDGGSSVAEGENIESSVDVVDVSKETKEDPKVSRQEDLQRHLTSEEKARPEEHFQVQIDEDVSTTAVVPEPEVDEGPAKSEDKKVVMKYGYQNMSEEYRVAGAVVQELMGAITKSGLPMDNGISVTDSDAEANLLLRGGSPQGVPLVEGRSCEGRQVFVYDLPSKFNVDLVGQCDTLLHWFNFCDYFTNEGFGTNVPTDVRNDRGEVVLVPNGGSWFLTHQYALELIFHARLKHYPCLTTDANQADLFFVPYYAGLDVIRWHFQPNVTNDRRDQLTFELLSWLDTQESWSRNKGLDHVLVLGKIGWDFRRSANSGHWGSKLLRLPSMSNPTKLLIERDPWHENDVGVPHPTFFHPKDDGEIRTWLDHVEQSDRRYLVSFAGMPRPGMTGNVRGHLIQQCLDNADDCFLLECVNTLCLRPDSTMNLFLHSHFCMQPPGDSPTRRSVFDSLIGGCIPVLFDPYTAYFQYPWHLPQNTSSYSVFIPSDDVMSGRSDIVEILKSISPEERAAMRTRIIREIIPGLLYSQPGTKHSEYRDAFDISIEALLHRVARIRAEKQQSMDKSVAYNM